MEKFIAHKFQLFRYLTVISAVVVSITFCQDLWAAQEAIVTSEKAVIYADEQLTSPVGFVRRGKVVTIGDVARNKKRVYPIIVSGKIAYIRVADVNSENEGEASHVIVAERFQKATQPQEKNNYSVSLFNYATQITVSKENDQLKNKATVNWYGFGIRGGAIMTKKWDMEVLMNIMSANAEDEVFRVLEIGLGGAARIIDTSRFKFKAFVQLIGIPFATYALADEFRVNGYGFSSGGGGSMTMRMGNNFGLEVYGGLYYTKISGFSSSKPYNPTAPSFVGSRVGVGLNYQL